MWAAAGYRGAWFEGVALGRFVAVDTPTMKFFDAGARIGAFEPTWGLNGELVYRSVSGDNAPVKNSLRATATFEFKVTGEVFAGATYGKDNADETQPATRLLFGMNLQVEKREITKL